MAIILYGFAASALPVWLLLAPRDYLSAFIKVGAILALAAGILFVRPAILMPPLTRFVDGTGPVFAGKIFPFCFITIACGAVSGFHALIASGTTPRLLMREGHARLVGYGAMLMESFVGVMAMVAACALPPGVYFAINSPAGIVGATADRATATISSWGYPVDAATLETLAARVGEHSLLNRTGARPELERHDGEPWHLHFHAADRSLPNGWAAGCATGLAVVLGGDLYDRLGVCTAPRCDRVYVDTSRNGTRRYCSTSCQNRVKTAAFRARLG